VVYTEVLRTSQVSCLGGNLKHGKWNRQLETELKPSVLLHTCNPSMQEAEAVGLKFEASETLCQENGV
jgi:hypothetical protein